MRFSYPLTALKGLIVGVTMLVPGVSGGSMAMILGIYDQLIGAVSSFFRHKRSSLLLLATFSLPALLGMFLFAQPLLHLLERFHRPMMYLFLGAVVGGVPLIYQKAQIRRISLSVVLWLLAGIVAVVAIGQLPPGLFAGANRSGVSAVALQVVGGVVVAVALILPGISVSYMLVLLNLYTPTMTAIARLDVIALLPMAVGGLLGVAGTTRILEKLMERYPYGTYLVILGFVLGSVGQVFPGMPVGLEIPVCGVLFALGFGAIYWLSLREEALSQPRD